jgi:hypothetical protein
MEPAADELRLARILANAAEAKRVLAALASDLEGEPRERVELAARVVANEVEATCEAWERESHLEEGRRVTERARRRKR